jgi:hypothetical protein
MGFMAIVDVPIRVHRLIQCRSRSDIVRWPILCGLAAFIKINLKCKNPTILSCLGINGIILLPLQVGFHRVSPRVAE